MLSGRFCLYIEVTLGVEVGRDDLCRNFDLYPEFISHLAVAKPAAFNLPAHCAAAQRVKKVRKAG